MGSERAGACTALQNSPLITQERRNSTQNEDSTRIRASPHKTEHSEPLRTQCEPSEHHWNARSSPDTLRRHDVVTLEHQEDGAASQNALRIAPRHSEHDQRGSPTQKNPASPLRKYGRHQERVPTYTTYTIHTDKKPTRSSTTAGLPGGGERRDLHTDSC
jgi:hypothetical protein